MSTCNQLDLETLGSRPVMLKNPPRTLHWMGLLQGMCSERCPGRFLGTIGCDPGVFQVAPVLI